MFLPRKITNFNLVVQDSTAGKGQRGMLSVENANPGLVIKHIFLFNPEINMKFPAVIKIHLPERKDSFSSCLKRFTGKNKVKYNRNET